MRDNLILVSLLMLTASLAIGNSIDDIVDWATLVGGIWALFNAIESSVNSDLRKRTSNWLKTSAIKRYEENILDTPIYFLETFKSVFGDKTLSWKCLKRSFIASTLFIMLVLIAYLNNNSLIHLEWTSFKELTDLIISYSALGTTYFSLGLIANLIPDYISLFETRWILSKAVGVTIKKLLILLIVDVILTGLISLLGIFILLALLFFYQGGNIQDFVSSFRTEFLSIIISTIDFKAFGRTDFSLGIFFYASYFTSIWFYMFLTSTILVRIISTLGYKGERLLSFLDIDQEPFNALGFVMIIFISIIFILKFFNIIAQSLLHG